MSKFLECGTAFANNKLMPQEQSYSHTGMVPIGQKVVAMLSVTLAVAVVMLMLNNLER